MFSVVAKEYNSSLDAKIIVNVKSLGEEINVGDLVVLKIPKSFKKQAELVKLVGIVDFEMIWCVVAKNETGSLILSLGYFVCDSKRTYYWSECGNICIIAEEKDIILLPKKGDIVECSLDPQDFYYEGEVSNIDIDYDTLIPTITVSYKTDISEDKEVYSLRRFLLSHEIS